MYPLFFFLLVTPVTAWAYVDPGSGMVMWQGLIAAVGALLVFRRHIIQWVNSIWRRVRGLPPVEVRNEDDSNTADKPLP